MQAATLASLHLDQRCGHDLGLVEINLQLSVEGASEVAGVVVAQAVAGNLAGDASALRL